MEVTAKCSICDDDIPEEKICIVSRGLVTLRKCSEMRNDGKIKNFEDVEFVKVHEKCRQKYTSVCRGKFTHPNFPKVQATNEDPSLQFTPRKNILRKCTFIF